MPPIRIRPEAELRASVSKPVVYGHFGGKEGIYAVIVDRESARLLDMITSRLGPDIGAREQVYEAMSSCGGRQPRYSVGRDGGRTSCWARSC